MRLILDSNIFIFGFGEYRKPSCERLLDVTLKKASLHRIRVSRLIVTEVKRNITPEAFKEFILLIMALTTIDEDSSVPFELGAKYESLGLKSSDALIGAFCEFVGGEVLVSENRHFLSQVTNLPYRVLTAEKCLKLLG